MRIKTIIEHLTPLYDEAVNAALAKGWELKRRDILPAVDGSHLPLLYAELELELSSDCDTCKHEDLNLKDLSAPCHRCVKANLREARE